MGKSDRPTGLTIIAILQMTFGIFCFAFVLYPNVTGYTGSVMDGGAAVMEVFFTSGLIIVGACSLVVGFGIWEGWQWTWGAAFSLSALGITASIVVISLYYNYALASALSRMIPVMVVCSIEIGYLSRKRTRDYFRVML